MLKNMRNRLHSIGSNMTHKYGWLVRKAGFDEVVVKWEETAELSVG